MSDKQGAAMAPFFVLLALFNASACAGAQEAAEPAARSMPGTRLMPPASLLCERNHLTSFTGMVIDYARDPESLRLVIATDADTVESFRLEPAADERDQLLIWGEAFSPDDWRQIESAPGTLRAGTRATAWVCEDGLAPTVIDWWPAAQDGREDQRRRSGP